MGSDDCIEQVKIRSQQNLEKLRRQREYDEEQSRRYLENLDRQAIENKKRNDRMLAQAQKEVDDMYIYSILRYQETLGYNLNPYKMSRSQLKYCYERIFNEMTKLSNKK